MKFAKFLIYIVKSPLFKDIWSNSDFKSLRDNFLKGNKEKLQNICKSCS